MAVIWGSASVIVAIFGLGIEPWDAVRDALQSGGASEESKSLMAFIAGYTLPLTAAFTGLTFAGLVGAAKGEDPRVVLGVVGLVLWVAGILAAELGLGLLPSTNFEPVSGPPWISLPLTAFQAYFASYGLPLMICSLAISVAAAVQVERWVHSPSELLT